MVGKKLKLDENRSVPANNQIFLNNNQNAEEETLLNQLIKNCKMDHDLKSQIMKDLKLLNLRNWFYRSDQEVIVILVL